MRSRRILGLLAVAAMLTGACASVPGSAAAVVDGEPIPLERLERIVGQRIAQTDPAETADFQAGMLHQLVRASVLSSLVDDLDIDVPQELVDQVYEEFLLFQLQGASDEQLDEILASVGLTRDDFHDMYILPITHFHLIQTSDRLPDAADAVTGMQIDVAPRFGTWSRLGGDGLTGELVPRT